MIETCAETIIKDFGIASPEEIDIEAIALTLEATVRACPLKGCEANIIGVENRAVITVNSNSSSKRRRFSIGHELGHWQRHRGQNFQCNKEDIGNYNNTSMAKEREADEFSANILMPWFLFKPIAMGFAAADFQLVFNLSERFQTSISATAARLIESNTFPAVLICHDQNKRRWFKRSKDVPRRWFPQDKLSHESSAFDIVYGNSGSDARQTKVCASAWFDRREAENYEVLEQTISYGDGCSLTLLEFIEDDMLDEYENTQNSSEISGLSW